MSAPLEGQVAVVTGAARGLGFAISRRLATAGATVVAMDADESALKEAVDSLSREGHAVQGVLVDVSDEDSVRDAARQVSASHPVVHILVNNAGIYPHAPFADSTFATWKRVLAVNLDSIYLVTKAFYDGMVREGYGRIINISSATFFIGQPNLTAYVASKGGVIGFTRVLANEAGPHGVTVNAVTPGLIATDTVLNSDANDLIATIVEGQSVKRPGEPDDIANCVGFLADPASAFVNGQVYNVDGGHRLH